MNNRDYFGLRYLMDLNDFAGGVGMEDLDPVTQAIATTTPAESMPLKTVEQNPNLKSQLTPQRSTPSQFTRQANMDQVSRVTQVSVVTDAKVEPVLKQPSTPRVFRHVWDFIKAIANPTEHTPQNDPKRRDLHVIVTEKGGDNPVARINARLDERGYPLSEDEGRVFAEQHRFHEEHGLVIRGWDTANLLRSLQFEARIVRCMQDTRRGIEKDAQMLKDANLLTQEKKMELEEQLAICKAGEVSHKTLRFAKYLASGMGCLEDDMGAGVMLDAAQFAHPELADHEPEMTSPETVSRKRC